MERSLEVLAEQITSLAADLESAHCRWLGLVAEFDRREGWATEGCRTCAQWVAWRCGLGDLAARERVRVARRLDDLPLVRAAFERAELTYSKVRAITRIESIADERELVELARSATAAQLDRIVAAYRGVARCEQGIGATHTERFLDWSIDEDGSYVLRGRLPAEQGAVLVKAIETAREDLDQGVPAGTPQDSREPLGARNLDALVEIADGSLAGAGAASTGGDRFQVVVHVEAAALEGDPAARCELESGALLSAEAARRLACDASLVRIIEQDGRPLSIGRKTRSIPPSLRRALRARDQGCQFPGCTQTRHTDAHHIEHWAQGGATDLTNLVTLCRHHHRLLHEGGFTVHRDRDALVFARPDGRRLPRIPRRRGARCGGLPSVPAGTVIQPVYDRLHLGYAVDALLDFAPIEPGMEALDDLPMVS